MYFSATEISEPVFIHFLVEITARLNIIVESKNLLQLSRLLTITFGRSIENALHLASHESEISTEKRLNKTKLICSYMVVAWAFREAVMDLENEEN